MAQIRGGDVREVSRRVLIWIVNAALSRSTPSTHKSHDGIEASEGYCFCIALVIVVLPCPTTDIYDKQTLQLN